MTAGPYSIGSDQWPGLSKLTEECGEVLQIVGKIIGRGGDIDHWDGPPDLKQRLEEELGDLRAAIDFVTDRCDLDREFIGRRVAKKSRTFRQWHANPA